MTTALIASCILFMAGQGAILTNRLALYWMIKLAAVYLALIASIGLTTVWEEWAIWRLTSSPENTSFFGSVLRSNLYVLVLVMAVAAALMLPKRLKSPDFLARRHFSVADLSAAPSNLRLQRTWPATLRVPGALPFRVAGHAAEWQAR